jgi:hypothetical protein
MKNDPFEIKDVKDEYPKVLKRLKGYAKKHKKKFYSKSR